MRRTKTTREIQREVTGLFVERLGYRDYTWKRRHPCIWPVNWVTKENYSGINYLLLTMTAIEMVDGTRDYNRKYTICPYYATADQIGDNGGRVREGAKSHMIISFLPTGQLAYGAVYNMMDTEGMDGFDYRKWAAVPKPSYPSESEFLTACKTLLNICKPDAVMAERIRMIEQEGLDTNDFVSTVFMAVVHGTGRPGQLDRFGEGHFSMFGKPWEEEERLTVEIGAAMLCDYLGICSWVDYDESDFKEYLVSHFKKGEGLIFRGALKAHEAVNYILDI